MILKRVPKELNFWCEEKLLYDIHIVPNSKQRLDKSKKCTLQVDTSVCYFLLLVILLSLLHGSIKKMNEWMSVFMWKREYTVLCNVFFSNLTCTKFCDDVVQNI